MQKHDSLSVVTLPIDRAFEILRNEWEMDSTDAADDPTLSADYLEVWWRYFGTPGSEAVLAFVTPTKTVVGLLFTRLETETYYRLPVRVVRCWVNSHAQRAGLFLRCDPDAAARAAAAYWAVRGRGWDLLRLQGLPAGEFADALLRHARELRCPGIATRHWGHSKIDIHEPWEAYLRVAVSSDTRKEVNRQGRRLAQLGAINLEINEAVEAVSIGMADFMKIELQSWKKESGEILASQPELAGFYQDVARTFAAKGEAVLAMLRLGDLPICAVLGLRSVGRLVALKTSFDERYAKYSPGSQLFKYLIEQAFCKGFKEFDFYGMMAVSRRWAKQDRRFVDLEIKGSTLRSRSVGMVKAAMNWWRSRRQDRHVA